MKRRLQNKLLAAFDLESVLTPESWKAIADRSGIKELRVTTRDIPDYDELAVRFPQYAKFNRYDKLRSFLSSRL